MTCFSTRAIVLKRIAYGDFDLIVTCWSLEQGKTTLMAKGAKNSKKRFAGVLEPFSELDIVGKPGRGLPLLLEATIVDPFSGIRSSVRKTAIASYWVEIVLQWMEAGHPQRPVYHLLAEMLRELDRCDGPPEMPSIYFQLHFLEHCGLSPDFFHCMHCHEDIASDGKPVMGMDLAQGGFLCSECAPRPYGATGLSAQTIKLFQWMRKMDWPRATRLRVSAPCIREGERFLETFLGYHLGKEFQSVKFLRQLHQAQEHPPVAISGSHGSSH